MADPSELEQALRRTGGLEGDTQPMECPPQVLALLEQKAIARAILRVAEEQEGTPAPDRDGRPKEGQP